MIKLRYQPLYEFVKKDPQAVFGFAVIALLFAIYDIYLLSTLIAIWSSFYEWKTLYQQSRVQWISYKYLMRFPSVPTTPVSCFVRDDHDFPPSLTLDDDDSVNKNHQNSLDDVIIVSEED